MCAYVVSFAAGGNRDGPPEVGTGIGMGRAGGRRDVAVVALNFAHRHRHWSPSRPHTTCSIESITPRPDKRQSYYCAIPAYCVPYLVIFSRHCISISIHIKLGTSPSPALSHAGQQEHQFDI